MKSLFQGFFELVFIGVDGHDNSLGVDEESAEMLVVNAPFFHEGCSVLWLAVILAGCVEAVGGYHLVEKSPATVEVDSELLYLVVALNKLVEPHVLESCHGVGRRPDVEQDIFASELVERNDVLIVPNSEIGGRCSDAAVLGIVVARRCENSHQQ